MVIQTSNERRSDRKRTSRGKIMAILAGGAVLGLGSTATLAAWTDTEWVFGGSGNDAGVGTSSFEVEQNVVAPFATTAFVQDETNPGQALTFGLDALSLTPGDSVYAPVALRTVANSVAGDLTLEPAVPAAGVVVVDAGGNLWNDLTVRVWVSGTAFTCDASTVASASIVQIASGALGTSGGTAAQTLAAASANTQYYCFSVTLPEPINANAAREIAGLQGRTVAPAWEFSAVSS
ncbi:SipW-dependent-type signal peptide-containing protein [Cryobacterium serini]|uniref:Acyl-CoA dehydrogenase n=1 Tax=Cryobacterium serini TaxID=1259201 RepID=A0A4V3IX54_9MICO|nr:SipW-dependent-type signal peptide-containing protein [Cryobacterium serini]TFD88924.1 acyl-CoA dehydrogenase [Cryobacterium serini]